MPGMDYARNSQTFTFGKVLQGALHEFTLNLESSQAPKAPKTPNR
jgi:hypothetical protein